MESDLYDEVLRESDNQQVGDVYIYHATFAERDELIFEPQIKVSEEVTIEADQTQNNEEDVKIEEENEYVQSDEKSRSASLEGDRPMWGKKETENEQDDEENTSEGDDVREEVDIDYESDHSEVQSLTPTNDEKDVKVVERSSDSDEEKKSHRKNRSKRERSRSREKRRSRSKNRKRVKRSKKRDSSSSSRGTYEGFDMILSAEDCPYSCKICNRGFYTIRELSEHEIRAYDNEICCTHCDKKSVSVAKFAAHTLHRHPTKSVVCFYCDERFGDSAEQLSSRKWDDFREHVYKEIIKKQIHKHSATVNGSVSNSAALRGVGKCPHGPPVKCKNFPQCPGAKCIYSHGQCRYYATCNKQSCPFDHSNRPRTCMSCLNDKKDDRRRRYS